MKIKDFELPVYLLKVCEKQKYVDELMSGRIYMNASGYFRKLPGEDSSGRRDPFDGRKPIDIGNQLMYLESEDGERLYLNGVPGTGVKDFSVGFSGDDCIPLFCTCILTDEVYEKTSETSWKIKEKYIKELSGFGEYAVMIPLAELDDKLRKYYLSHTQIAFKYGPVRYTNIMKEYSLNDEENSLDQFFIKDVKYQLQNEWRLIAYGKQRLINKPTGHWILDVGKFKYAIPLKIEALRCGEFNIGEERPDIS